MAAVILAAVISVLRLDRQSEIQLAVLACFAIGLGAVLTPIGEPLSTIVVNKLNEDFFYLLNLVGTSVIPFVVIFGIFAAFAVKEKSDAKSEIASGKETSLAQATEEEGGESNRGTKDRN